MDNITIFGTGNMGTALADVFARAGASVQQISSADDSSIDNDIVILATPYDSLSDITAQYGDQLADKIVVDITNPVDFDTFDSLLVPADTSAAAMLQRKLPAARVVKAFNTNFADTLTSQQVGPNSTTVLVAGDDADAKRTLIDAVTATGLGAIDAGSLDRARELESIGFLQITLANDEKISWSAGFSVVS